MAKIEEYDKFMAMARQAQSKSTCIRGNVGAVIVKNGRFISDGYNHVPNDIIKCTSTEICFKNENGIKSGTLVDEKDCRALHAEQWAIINAAKSKIKEDISGATIFCTHHPCIKCALAIVAADIKEVVYQNDYPDNLAKDFLKMSGVKVIQYSYEIKTNFYPFNGSFKTIEQIYTKQEA